MPKYNFVCDKCEFERDTYMSISAFIKSKNQKIKCEDCDVGVLFHRVASITSIVEKSQEQSIMDIQEEVRKTVKKIRDGDRKTIDDVYGDEPNPYKK